MKVHPMTTASRANSREYCPIVFLLFRRQRQKMKIMSEDGTDGVYTNPVAKEAEESEHLEMVEMCKSIEIGDFHNRLVLYYYHNNLAISLSQQVGPLLLSQRFSYKSFTAGWSCTTFTTI